MLEGECRIYKHSGVSMRTFVFRVFRSILFHRLILVAVVYYYRVSA